MKNRLRTVGAIVAGVIAWAAAATAGKLVLRLFVDGYREAESGMAFNATMMVGRLAASLVASIASGVAARVVAGSPGLAPWVAGLVLLTAFIPLYVALWPRFPAPYHLFFLASLAAVPPLAARTISLTKR